MDDLVKLEIVPRTTGDSAHYVVREKVEGGRGRYICKTLPMPFDQFRDRLVFEYDSGKRFIEGIAQFKSPRSATKAVEILFGQRFVIVPWEAG